MSWGLIGTVIGGVAAIVVGITWWGKYLSRKFDKTPDENNQDIDKKIAEEERTAEKTGRPG